MDKLRLVLALLLAALPLRADLTLANPSDPVTDYAACGTGLGGKIWEGGGLTVVFGGNITATHATKLQSWVLSTRAGSVDGFNFIVDNIGDADPSTDDVLKVTVDGSTDMVLRSSVNKWTVGSGHHRAGFTWNGTSLNGTNFEFAIDGTDAGVAAFSTGVTPADDTGNTAYVGSSNTQSQTFNGYLEYILICGTEVSEINLYRMTRRPLRTAMRYCPAADILAAWDFMGGKPGDTESGQATIIDISGNGNHCTLNGGDWSARGYNQLEP